MRCPYFFYRGRKEDPVLEMLVSKVDRIQRELGSLSSVIMDRLSDVMDRGVDEATGEALDEAEKVEGRKETAEAELEAQRKELRKLEREIDDAGAIFNRSQKVMDFDPKMLRETIEVGLELSGVGPLKRLHSENGDPPNPEYVLPEMPDSWQPTLDALRPPRGRTEPFWEWRKKSPQPVAFKALVFHSSPPAFINVEYTATTVLRVNTELLCYRYSVPLRSAKGRQLLSKLLRRHPDLITVQDAAATLAIPAREASKMLSRWASQGWLKRVRRGLYAPIPLAAESSEQVLADPWILVPRLYDPGYVGGWTAAEHWDFTEQIFRSLCVFTSKPVRTTDVVVQSIPFHLKHIPEDAHFGLAAVWRENVRVLVSDRARTIVDMLDDPSTGGGMRHVSLCLDHYVRSENFDRKGLLEYAVRRGNGAVFKRLGFLVDRIDEGETQLIEELERRLTKGNAKLDPSLPAGKLVTKWRLWIPAGWAAAKA